MYDIRFEELKLSQLQFISKSDWIENLIIYHEKYAYI